MEARYNRILTESLSAPLHHLGFSVVGSNTFERSSSDSLVHVVKVPINVRTTTVELSPLLGLRYFPALQLIEDGLRSAFPGYALKAQDNYLEAKSLHDLVARPQSYVCRIEPRGRGRDFTDLVELIARDVTAVAESYFARGTSLPSLVSFIENHPDAGGAMHFVVLLALYVSTGRKEQAKRLIRELAPLRPSEMTEKFCEYLRSHLDL